MPLGGIWAEAWKGYKGYKDGLQPESLANGNWLVKQNQPVSKIETKSDTNLRSLYESWFRNALISKSVILWWQAKKGINSELEGANTRRVLNILSKRSLYLMRSSHTSARLQKKSTCFSSWTSPHSHLSQMLEPPCHLQDSIFKWFAPGLHNTATPRHGKPLKRGEFLSSRNSYKMLVPACFSVRTLMASNRSNSTWRLLFNAVACW